VHRANKIDLKLILQCRKEGRGGTENARRRKPKAAGQVGRRIVGRRDFIAPFILPPRSSLSLPLVLFVVSGATLVSPSSRLPVSARVLFAVPHFRSLLPSVSTIFTTQASLSLSLSHLSRCIPENCNSGNRNGESGERTRS